MTMRPCVNCCVAGAQGHIYRRLGVFLILPRQRGLLPSRLLTSKRPPDLFMPMAYCRREPWAVSLHVDASGRGRFVPAVAEAWSCRFRRAYI